MPESSGTSWWPRNSQKHKKWEGICAEGDSKMVGGRPDDIIIPVMGVTGTGKSTFINQLLGRDAMKTNNGLKSMTAKPEYVVVPLSATPLRSKYPSYPNRRIVLLDTPGFNDSQINDHEILRRISVWLAASYAEKLKVSGIIFLHDISTSRMTPIGQQNISLFQELCGTKALSRVILGQTHWENLGEKRLTARNVDLENIYWKALLKHGATIVKVSQPPEDGSSTTVSNDHWDIVDLILDEALNKISPVLRIQKELVDLDKRLEDTAAAGAIRKSLKSAIKANELMQEGCTSEQDIAKYRKEQEELVGKLDQLKIPLSLRLRAFFRL